ncbi:MAG: hypothetical protein DCC67_06395 [Planctomycetota bacterium]|nr:MAG: hypothetical protein DCC67_06395 [Planctomycetota bacterium]
MAEKSPSSWDDLIKQLGAAPPPDALERRRPAIETSFQPPEVASPPAKPKAGNWNALASQLGIELPPEPEPAPPAEPIKPPSRRDVEPPRAASAKTGAADLEATFAGIEPMESMFEEIIEEEMADVDFAEGDDDEELNDDEDLDDEHRRRREAERQGLSGEAARSAFEALFEAGSFSALPPQQERRRPADEQRGPDWRDFDEVGAGAAAEFDVEAEDDVEAEGDDDDDRDADHAAGRADEEQDRTKRRRRRRRRGRGRDRTAGETRDAGPADAERDESDADQAAWPAPRAVHEDESDDDLPPDEEGRDEAHESDDEGKRSRRRRPRRRRRGVRDAAEEGRLAAPVADSAGDKADEGDEQDDIVSPAAEEHDGEADEDGDDDALSRASHKNIPTWSEAIGVIVETNMQARKTSPQRPSPSRGRGRGRGWRRGKS